MITDTRSKQMEAGKYHFEVVAMPVQVAAGDFLKWQFEFRVVGSNDKPIKMSYFDNQVGELLRAVGCKEVEPEIFDWEPEQVYGRLFEAELFYEEDAKGKINEYTKKVQTYRKLRNYASLNAPVKTAASAPAGKVTYPKNIPWED